MFTAVVLSLVAIILVARAQLVSSGAVTISINDDPEKSITVAAGDKLLQTLSAQGIFLASACGAAHHRGGLWGASVHGSSIRQLPWCAAWHR